MVSTPNFKRTKFACYLSCFTMASVFSFPPILFVTLRELYGISYTLLGTLVLTNFCTQLLVDLIFSFFSKKFNVRIILKIMPCLTSLGLIIYALFPLFFESVVYIGLLLGTVIFSVAAGLSEVLLSPTIAAIPSETPQKDMSLLHSLYAFGIFTVAIASTLFLKIFGGEHWVYLALFFATLPLFAAILFLGAPMPDVSHERESVSVERTKQRTIGFALCTACIFFGSCAENAMTNWISSYMEIALHIDKTLGDVLGMAGFALLLWAGRFLYAKFGRNIEKVLLLGMIGATVCYLVAGLSPNAVLAFIACILTGLFTAMLWPGTLIFMEEKLPNASVAAYALMAAGGDLGASIAPQLLGVITDQVSASTFATELGGSLHLSAEQIGLKTGMIVSAIFPLIGIFVLLALIRHFKKAAPKQPSLPVSSKP